MNSSKLIFLRICYCIAMFLVASFLLKSESALNDQDSVSVSLYYTRESYYYVAIIGFIVNAFMFLFDKPKSELYLITFGFSLAFFSVAAFQIIAAVMICVGLVAYFFKPFKR